MQTVWIADHSDIRSSGYLPLPDFKSNSVGSAYLIWYLPYFSLHIVLMWFIHCCVHFPCLIRLVIVKPLASAAILSHYSQFAIQLRHCIVQAMISHRIPSNRKSLNRCILLNGISILVMMGFGGQTMGPRVMLPPRWKASVSKKNPACDLS